MLVAGRLHNQDFMISHKLQSQIEIILGPGPIRWRFRGCIFFWATPTPSPKGKYTINDFLTFQADKIDLV